MLAANDGPMLAALGCLSLDFATTGPTIQSSITDHFSQVTSQTVIGPMKAVNVGLTDVPMFGQCQNAVWIVDLDNAD